MLEEGETVILTKKSIIDLFAEDTRDFTATRRGKKYHVTLGSRLSNDKCEYIRNGDRILQIGKNINSAEISKLNDDQLFDCFMSLKDKGYEWVDLAQLFEELNPEFEMPEVVNACLELSSGGRPKGTFSGRDARDIAELCMWKKIRCPLKLNMTQNQKDDILIEFFLMKQSLEFYPFKITDRQRKILKEIDPMRPLVYSN